MAKVSYVQSNGEPLIASTDREYTRNDGRNRRPFATGAVAKKRRRKVSAAVNARPGADVPVENFR